MGLLLRRKKTSLRLRLFGATVALLALALGLSALAFERVARSFVADAVHAHLSTRAKEVQDSVARFQRERSRTVHDWSVARNMQDTFDLGDPKFAEDHLRRAIQDQEGAIETAALLSVEERIVTLVHHDPGAAWGFEADGLRGVQLDVARLRGRAAEDAVSIALAPLSAVDQADPDVETVVMTAPVRDFFGDLVGWLVVAVAPGALPRLLDEVNGPTSAFVPVLVDASGRLVLTVPRAAGGLAAEVARAPGGAQPGALERIAHAEAGEEGDVLAVRTSPSPDPPGWTAVMAVDEREASGRVDRLRNILAGLFVVVLVAAGIAAIVSIRQAARPLTDVADSMVRVAGGDLTTRVRGEYAGELGALVSSFNGMVEEVARSRDELQRTEALRREVEIAHRIQTAILPVSPTVRGFEVAARMVPAEDVGGDLYDLLTVDGVFWVLVGDVSGHGINSGLVMMMAQAAAHAAIADDPRCSPAQVISAVNRVVHENVRRRMGRDDYMTLMAARHMGDGRFVAAGAHQPIFLARGAGRVEVVEPAGPWVGLSPAMDAPSVELYEFRLGPGDLVCFVTDGILEANGAGAGMFGEERVKELLAGPELPSAAQALGSLFETVERWSPVPADDMTAVVLRRTDELS